CKQTATGWVICWLTGKASMPLRDGWSGTHGRGQPVSAKGPSHRTGTCGLTGKDRVRPIGVEPCQEEAMPYSSGMLAFPISYGMVDLWSHRGFAQKNPSRRLIFGKMGILPKN